MLRLRTATALFAGCCISLLGTACDQPTPTDLGPTPALSEAPSQPIAGEDPGDAATIMAAPPAFTAAPFAPDFVVTGSESGFGGEHFFPSNGDGTFGPKSNIPGLGLVDGLDVADMDRDGDNDFLVCDGGAAETYLYTNDGTGSFATSVVATGVSSFFCTNVREGDFNEDGLKDFVVGDNRVSNGMFVYLQTGPGTFTKVLPGLDVASWSTVGGNSLFGVAVGDVDGDGHQDVLVLGYFGIGAGEMRFYKGDGTGAMAASTVLFDIGTDFGVAGTTGLGLFDLEGDGDLDIVAGGGTSGGVGGGGTHYIYTNDGAGNFTAPGGFDFDLNAQTGVDAYDFDGDGDHDLVVVTFGTRSLYYVENLGGTLAAPVLVDALDGSSIGVGAPPLVTVIEVDIDIKFCSNPNGFNCKSKGMTPVTIFGSASLDINDIDIGSLQLCEDGNLANCTGPPLSWSVADRGDPTTDLGAAMCAIDPMTGEELDTLNPDGFDDLDVAFDTQELVGVIGCGALNKGDASLTLVLVGQTLGGTPITSVPIGDVGIDQLLIQNN